MWQVDNHTPFAAEPGWTRDREGAETWLVVVKATFDIRPDGHCEVAAQQAPVLRAPQYHGEPGRSSLRYDHDFVPCKRTTDIVLLGHAHAPGARPVTELEVGLQVGSLRKTLRVFGDRRWGIVGPTAPQPFTRMPLVYERAFGGADPRPRDADRDWYWHNPVGTGFAVSGAGAPHTRPPNIEDPRALVRSWRDRPAPAGFGAISSHWQPRAGFAGTHDSAWAATRMPLPPSDFDERFHQCAPTDQQSPSFLHGGETVALVHLHPQHAQLRFTLPRLHLGFETRFTDGSRQIHASRHLHTVILEPDDLRLSLVWHSSLFCHYKVHKLHRTIVVSKQAWPAVQRQPPASSPAECAP